MCLPDSKLPFLPDSKLLFLPDSKLPFLPDSKLPFLPDSKLPFILGGRCRRLIRDSCCSSRLRRPSQSKLSVAAGVAPLQATVIGIRIVLSTEQTACHRLKSP